MATAATAARSLAGYRKLLAERSPSVIQPLGEVKSGVKSNIKRLSHAASDLAPGVPGLKGFNQYPKEAVLERLLNLTDEDICWVVRNAGRRRPQLELKLAKDDIQMSTTEPELPTPVVETREPDAKVTETPTQVAKCSTVPSRKPILHFMVSTIYVPADEGCVKVRVLRTGFIDGESEVSFATRDEANRDGTFYRAASGSLVFKAGERLKDFSIELIDDLEWNPNRQFFIKLLDEGLKNAELEEKLSCMRVVVIDEDPFPTPKYKIAVWEDRLDEVPNAGLAIEYIKMQWQQDNIRRGSIKIILADIVVNLHFLAKALLQMYLVDSVLNIEVPESHLLMVHNRYHSLACVAILILAPQLVEHYLHLLKPFSVNTMSGKLLQKSLFDRLLYYSPAADINQADVLMAMSGQSVDDIVTKIYQGSLDVLGEMGRLAVICIIQFVAPIVFDHPIPWSSIIPLCVLPIPMLLFLMARDQMSTNVLFERMSMHDNLMEFMDEAVQNQALIQECNARDKCMDVVEGKIKEYHASMGVAKKVVVNNQQFAEWLSLLLLAFYTLWGGKAVIDGHMPLGLFVTNLGIFRGLGELYSSMYQFVLSIQEFTPALKRLTRLMNAPSELCMRAEMAQHLHRLSDEIYARSDSEASATVSWIDQLPICVGGVKFHYESSVVSHSRHVYCVLCKLNQDGEGQNYHGEMRFSQGQLIQVIGPPGEGKTTLLKLIGGILLPELNPMIRSSNKLFFFVPPTIDTIYVASEQLFFRGSLYQNLTLAVRSGSDDGSADRITRICKRLGLADAVSVFLTNHQEHWMHHLSHTQLALLSLARALIGNPGLLCMERHWMGFNEEVSMRILHVLREHVDCRGLEQDLEDGHTRRLRTCVMTGTEKQSSELSVVDSIFSVSNANGIELVHDRLGTQRAMDVNFIKL